VSISCDLDFLNLKKCEQRKCNPSVCPRNGGLVLLVVELEREA
jgi:hypothetical protein